MGLADTSRAQLRYIDEGASFAVIPNTGNAIDLRMTGESLDHQIQKETSKEIRADRQTSDLIVVGAGASGGVNFELSYAEYDAFLAAALMGSWSVYGTKGVGATFTATFTATTITASAAPTGTSAFTGLSKGQWFKLTAPTHANDGKFFKVSEVTAPTGTVVTVDAATPLAVGTSIANCTIATSRLANGTTMKSFSMEKEFSDIGQFFAYRGMTVSQLSMGLQSGQIVNGSFSFIGKDSVRGSSTQLPGTAVASQEYEPMNAVSGVGDILENGSAITGTFVKDLSLALDNKLRSRDAVGNLGPVSIGAGTLALTGTLDVYLADGTLYDKFTNNTSTSISFRVVDPSGNGYVVTLPAVRYGDAKVNAGGMDQDAMISLPFTAIRDVSHLKTIFIDRVGVAVP